MSLRERTDERLDDRFPRVSGDEPTGDPVGELLPGFSPRERG